MTDGRAAQIGLRLPAWERLPDIELYMDQVILLLTRELDGTLPAGEITRSMVNNYVKAGLVPRPVKKKYDRSHVAQLLMIAVLKQALSMEEISRVLFVLCGDGVEAGYARFAAEAAQPDGAADDAVTAAVSAAASTIRAKRRIAEMDCGNFGKK